MTISVAQAQLFFLALTRILAMLIHIPVLGGRAIPNQVKIGLGVLVTIVLAGVALPGAPLPPEAPAMAPLTLAAAIARELIIGTLAGFAAVLTFGAVQTAGELMGLGSGFASGRVFNPAFADSGSALDQFFLIIATLLFVVSNGHHLALLALQQTFAAAPLASPVEQVLTTGGLDRMLTLTSQLFGAGVLLAAPIIGATLMADVTLALLARVAPQVHVFFLGMPLKVGLGLGALALALAVLIPQVASLMNEIGARMAWLITN
jgi:flagellar biosynthetic protein FliR